jgi:hypothetical protein
MEKEELTSRFNKQRDNSMLTFETSSVQGVTLIMEKLGVSIS